MTGPLKIFSWFIVTSFLLWSLGSLGHSESSRDGHKIQSPVSTAPLPHNGAKTVYTTQETLAPLRLVTSGDMVHYFVKISAWDTDEVVQTIFIRAGDSVETTMPLGSFRIKYATGRTWVDEEDLFGPDTGLWKADKRFDFSVEGNIIRGYVIELILQQGGNLSTSRLPPSAW